MAALKNSQMIKERYPDTEVTIHYIDIRAAGEMYEEYYIRTQKMGVDFIRGKVAEIYQGDLRYENTLECRPEEEAYDMVVLSTGYELSAMKTPWNAAPRRKPMTWWFSLQVTNPPKLQKEYAGC